MKSKICMVAIVCLILSGLALARGFDVSHIRGQMITLDDPNDPNEPVDIPE